MVPSSAVDVTPKCRDAGISARGKGVVSKGVGLDSRSPRAHGTIPTTRRRAHYRAWHRSLAMHTSMLDCIELCGGYMAE